ncbi:hypothetical protein JCM8547_007688 [Rhodosporidiobolus lusitaniae]
MNEQRTTAAMLARLRHAIWPEPADPEERKLLRRADAMILSYLCLQFCVNYLDRVNFVNAYVSGMREALHMDGDEYNMVIACFTIGFAVANIPQNLMILIVPPRYLFTINGVLWGILTALTACATKVSHLYAIKFFQGVFESSTFVGAHYILGSWYIPSEIGRRAAIFSASGQAASLFSGSLMARLYTDLHGKRGVEGWQWMFIICGAITIPVALYGLFAFPDTPATTRTRFLTAEQRALAISRLPVKPGKTKFEWSLVGRVLGRWHLWALSVVWIAGGALEGYSAWGVMALWMRAQKVVSPSTGKLVARFTVPQLNYHPLGIASVAIVALLVTAILTDHRPDKRYAVNLGVALCALVYSIIPLIGSERNNGVIGGGVSTAAWYFSFYLSGVSYAGQMSNFSWANEIAVEDEQERSVLLAAMNVIAYAFNAWFGPVFWPATDAPHFKRGFRLTLAFVPILVVSTLVTRWLQRREQRARQTARAAMTETELSEATGGAEGAGKNVMLDEEEGESSGGETGSTSAAQARAVKSPAEVRRGSSGGSEAGGSGLEGLKRHVPQLDKGFEV